MEKKFIYKVLIYFVIPLFIPSTFISCQKNETKIEDLNQQEDSLRLVMENRYSFQEIKDIEDRLSDEKTTTNELLSTFAPKLY